MNYIDVKNFRKYEQLFGDNGPAKIGHVNYVIKNTNESVANLQNQINNISGGGSYAYIGDSNLTTNVDWSDATIQEVNMMGDSTFTFSNGTPGTLYTLLLKQEQVGQKTITWPIDVFWNGGTAPSLINVPNVIIDDTYAVGTGFGAYTYSTFCLQADGKIIVGGSFISYDTTLTNRITRLNSDGTVDNTFNPGVGANGDIETVAIQTDGKIVIGGNFTSYDGNFVNFIARLNSDGSFDPTFNTAGGFDSRVKDIKIQNDGKVVCAGEFYTFDGNSSTSIVRINTDGSYDATFVVGMGFNNRVDSIVIQSDGRIVCVGPFNNYDITIANGVARLNSDGSIDATFATNVGSGFTYGPEIVTLQIDGKILCGGGFDSFDGVLINRLVRLNLDGTLDNTFNTGTGFSDTVTAIGFDPIDGKIVVGGFFPFFNGTVVNRMVKLNSDGSLDTNFSVGAGFNIGIVNFVFQNDGKLVVGGYFTQFNGKSAPGIIRLLFTTPILSYNKFSFVYNGMYYIAS